MEKDISIHIKKNTFFNSKIKTLDDNEKKKFINKNIICIYNSIFYKYECKYSSVTIEYKVYIYLNKINFNFIIYFSKYRYYNNSKYLYRINNSYSYIEKKFYDIPLSNVNNKLNCCCNFLRTKPYIKKNKKNIFIIQPILNRCVYKINILKKNIEKLVKKLPLNSDCTNIILDYIF